MQPLRDHIRQNLSRLRSRPCLLISSSPPPAVSTAVAGTKTPSSIPADREALEFQCRQDDARARAFVERNAQSLTTEFDLRSAPCRISSAHPTMRSVEEAVSLARRTGLKGGSFGGGDGVVIGIGSGAAMELAKAVADSLFGDVDSYNDDDDEDECGSLILAPCTLGSLWAASSDSPSILLDTKEEMLLPHLTPSWTNVANPGRRGTVVTLDASHHLALPPLYSPSRPPRRSDYSHAAPSMAHVAAAALVIALDAARSVDAASKAGIVNGSADLREHVEVEMREVALACASVLALAAEDARSIGSGAAGNGDDGEESNAGTARDVLLDVIPRLSPLVEQASFVARAPLTTAGTVPQKLANALLPVHFPQCHVITYLASVLPAMCDALAGHALPENGTSCVEEIVHAIMYCDEEDMEDEPVQLPWLSQWAAQVTTDAGIPTMAGLAYGTPDVNALIGKLDSYETLVTSLNNGAVASGGGQDEHWFMEDVLQRSLNR